MFVAVRQVAFLSAIKRTSPIMPTNTFTTKEALIAQIEILRRKEKARRIIALAIGDEVNNAMNAWCAAKTEYEQDLYFVELAESSDRFDEAMKDWRGSVAELSDAMERRRAISK